MGDALHVGANLREAGALPRDPGMHVSGLLSAVCPLQASAVIRGSRVAFSIRSLASRRGGVQPLSRTHGPVSVLRREALERM